MAFYSNDDLVKFGFKYLGKNVKISQKASLYGVSRIEIGDNSRVDDFCILSAGEGGIIIGKYVHIACYCSLLGKETILMEDFSGISSKVALYSSNDDYSGNAMTGPTVPPQFTNVRHGKVVLRKHVIVGASSIILPDVEINEGSAIGALSLVTTNCRPYSIYSGVPAKFVKPRDKKIFELEKLLLNQM
jgi:galactoside O-acetyltransferase